MESPQPWQASNSEAMLLTLDDDASHTTSHAPGLEEVSTNAEAAQHEQQIQPASAGLTNHDREDYGPAKALTNLLKGKEREWSPVVGKKGRLQLLDLPVDILREIINQLPHTNDLTSLALTHSAFHSLTVPCIYSRFDIVWPDSSTHSEPRTGVDALTYGLSTLVMAEEVFGEGPRELADGSVSGAPGGSAPAQPQETELSLDSFPVRIRRWGNWYAHYTKKFSLGNGPADWVQEYLITKESGKMLGTLVALALARMRNLETFVWDMPTGVLRDVWLALSSLAHRKDGKECRLERIWVRWHDNSQVDPSSSPPPPPGPLSNIPVAPNGAHASIASANPPAATAAHAIPVAHPVDRVEHPTFSVLPPLKALSVLDIDELLYVDEMSVLIGRSQKRLKELRVGIARHARQRDWVSVWEGCAVQQVDHSSTWSAATSRIAEKRHGGILGILIGRTYDLRRPTEFPEHWPVNSEIGPGTAIDSQYEKTGSGQQGASDLGAAELPASQGVDGFPDQEPESPCAPHPQPQSPNPFQISPNVIGPSGGDDVTTGSTSTVSPTLKTAVNAGVDCDSHGRPTSVSGPTTNKKLRLEILELERVPLAVFVLQRAFDWSRLTQLTLLDCQNHEQLWKALRRMYTPREYQNPLSSITSRTNPPKVRKSSTAARSDYLLQLKKIHTNNVSSSLISFIREALAPNSLEVLFLQEERTYTSSVTVDGIYRGALRRHRTSLRKLLIDSGERESDIHFPSSSRWRRWMLTREILSFITSGKMPSLRELAFCIDYRDWHFFLQRLPLIPHVRSLYIPKIGDHVHGNNIDSREMALQVVDIVTLKPDIEVCYMGIGQKCFEVLENKPASTDLRPETSLTEISPGGMPGAYGGNDPLVMTDDETEDDDEDDELDADAGAISAGGSDSDDSDDHDVSDDDSYMHEDEKRGPKLRLREILFYDDKVAIFKARHGRL